MSRQRWSQIAAISVAFVLFLGATVLVDQLDVDSGWIVPAWGISATIGSLLILRAFDLPHRPSR